MPVQLSFADERVLAVMAHPDDAELLCAGTLARARADGAAIGLCVLCRGDKGQPVTPVAELARQRRQETTEAAELLGAQTMYGDFADGELTDDYASRMRLVEIFRRFRPTLVIAHAPGDYHADHRAASALAESASWFCSSRGHRTPSPPLETPPALWFCDALEMLGFEPTFYVDVSEYVDLKRRMLDCHRSQLQRSGDRDYTPLEHLLVRQAAARGSQAGSAAAEAFRQHQALLRTRAW